ncbi:restriction endonuclease [Candidatus Roizmanbacteria bacterium]|nr:restriction endonuclease [Candidatus Roizmanbacteria bacterium]
MNSSNNNEWTLKVKQFCKEFNIPEFYLSNVLYDPKVTPMIRGKAFEFSAMLALKRILLPVWEVSKPIMNPQLGYHDMDIAVKHKPSNKVIRVECKLAKNTSYRLFADGHNEIQVKCMRSRTLGTAMVKSLSKKWKIPEDMLTIHNDNYLPDAFDVVITSIGNAFYKTNPQTEVFEWQPTDRGTDFLNSINLSKENNLKDFAFNQMYIAISTDLIGSKLNSVCRRRKCMDKKHCPFIPNYPKIIFDKTLEPINGWVSLERSETLLKSLLKRKT